MSLLNAHRRRIKISEIIIPGLVQNTFIGNASSFITSPSDVETRFGIASGSVSDFLIVGTDVYFKVNLASYDLADSAFNALSEPATSGVTYFIDRDNLIRNLGNSTFRYQNSLNFFYGKGVTNVGSQGFRRTIKNGIGSNYLYLPNNTIIGSEAFSRHYSDRINIWNTTTLSTNCLENTTYSPPIKLYVHHSLETSNAGSVHAELTELHAAGRVTFVPDAEKGANVDPVIDLAATNITSSTFDLTFSPPASDNGISFYEVWFDDLTDNPKQLYWFDKEILASGSTVSGFVSGTTYKVKIVACDIYWNRSEFSNEITITTL